MRIQLSMYTQIKQQKHESIHVFNDKELDFTAIIAINDSVRGPAIGGCRSLHYNSFEEAMLDSIYLSFAMSKKALKHNLDYNTTSISLIFDPNHLDFVKEQIETGEISALKIHSRIQKLTKTAQLALVDTVIENDIKIPIIFDAFYYGEDIEFKPSLTALLKLCKLRPNNKIIVAHCGGYRLIQFFFHLRQVKNVYYDLSLSLQMLSDSSLRNDLKKLIRHTPSNRIMYGSDYYYTDPKLQFNILKEFFIELNISKEEQDRITYLNAFELFINTKH